MSEVPLFEVVEAPLGAALSNVGRGGGGGGGGAADVEGAVGDCDDGWPDWTSWRASSGSIPDLLFQVTPDG